MTKYSKVFEVGKKVRRTGGTFCGMKVGDIGTVVSQEQGGVIIKEYSNSSWNGHEPLNLELVEELPVLTIEDTGFQVRDKVWDIRHGNGEVVRLCSGRYPVVVEFDKEDCTYTPKGQIWEDYPRTLFHGHDLKISGEVFPEREPEKKELSTDEKRQVIIEFMKWKNKSLYKKHQDLSLSIFNHPDSIEIEKTFTDTQILEIYDYIKECAEGDYIYDGGVCPWCILHAKNCDKCGFGQRYGQCPENLSTYKKVIKKNNYGDFSDTIGSEVIKTKIKELFI